MRLFSRYNLTISFISIVLITIGMTSSLEAQTGCSNDGPVVCTCPANTSNSFLNWDEVQFEAALASQNFLAGMVGFNIDFTPNTAKNDQDQFNNARSFGMGDEELFLSGGTPTTITITFESPILGLQFSIYDIDFSETITVQGFNGVTAQTYDFRGAPVDLSTRTWDSETGTGQGTGVTTQTFTGDGTGCLSSAICGTVNFTFTSAVDVITISTGGNSFFGGLSDINYCSPDFGEGAVPACLNSGATNGLILASADGGPGPSVYVVDLDANTSNTTLLFTDNTTGVTSINALAADPINEKVYYHNAAGNGFNLYDGPTGSITQNCFLLPSNIGGTIAGEGATYQDGFIYVGVTGSGIAGEDEIWRITLPDPTDPCNNPPGTDDAFLMKSTDFDLGDFVINNGELFMSDRLGAGDDFRVFDLLNGSETLAVSSYDGQIGLGAQNSLFAVFEPSGTPSYQQVSTTGVLQGSPVALASPWPSGAEPIDASACINPESSLPVTLAEFSSYYAGSGLKLLWSTATEAFNAGFYLYGYYGDGERVKLSDRLVPTKRPNSVEPQYYEEIVDIPDGVLKLGISSVDMRGVEDHFGPYEVGATYGEEPDTTPVDWKSLKEDYNQKMISRGYTMKGGKMRKSAHSENRGILSSIAKTIGVSRSNSKACNVAVGSEGLYRVTYDEIIAAGCDFLDNVKANKIAVTFDGEPVARRVKNGKFRNGSFIDFYGVTPWGEHFLYNAENVYQIIVDKSKVRKHKNENGTAPSFVEEYRETISIENNVLYDLTVVYEDLGGEIEKDPWYEGFAVNPDSMQFVINASDDIDTTESGLLKLRLIGLSDFPEVEIDHEVKVELNGKPVGSSIYQIGGQVLWDIEAKVDGSNLNPGENTLKITVNGGPGAPYDVVSTDSYSLEYTRPAVAVEDLVAFKGDQSGYKISGYSKRKVQTYGYTPDGDLYKIKTVKNKVAKGNFSATFKGIGKGTKYWVSPAEQFKSGEVYASVYDEGMFSGGAEVLILSHPALMGEAFDSYVNYIKSKGFTTKVVSVLDIYEAKGYGMVGINPIRDYLKSLSGVEYVAIVGGTTTEYPGVEEVVNYVPTDFQISFEFLYHTPCDGCIADFNGDYVPELKIFRIPSRQESDTLALVNKAKDYNPDPTVLLIAEHTQESNFGSQLDSVSNELGGFSKTKIYLDQVASENGLSLPGEINEVVSIAKPMIISEINGGQGIVMFDGHGAPFTWTFNNLFTDAEAGNLVNNDPHVVIPLACFTTYYHRPGSMSLADQLLFNSNGGSVAITGASVVSNLEDNGLYAKDILEQMCKGKNMADAVYETKIKNSTKTDQVINWDTIGDGFVTIDSCSAEDSGDDNSSGGTGTGPAVPDDNPNDNEIVDNPEDDLVFPSDD